MRRTAALPRFMHRHAGPQHSGGASCEDAPDGITQGGEDRIVAASTSACDDTGDPFQHPGGVGMLAPPAGPNDRGILNALFE